MTADPPEQLRAWSLAATARAHAALVGRLRDVRVDVDDGELVLRVKCVGGILVLLSNAVLGPELKGQRP